MHKILFILSLLFGAFSFSQTLPSDRSVDWILAGLRDTTTLGFTQIDMQAEGVIGNGTSPNDVIVDNVLSSISSSGAILNFPEGNFLFNETIHLPSNIVIKGKGAEETTFTMDLGGSGHSFKVSGSSVNTVITEIIDSAPKDQDYIVVSNPSIFTEGDWIRILLNDSSLVTSSWAYKTVGQIVQIKNITNNNIILKSPLRMEYDLSLTPYIVKMNPVSNVGIECLKIHRLDNTAPSLSSSIYFGYAVNCWVNGIESENCTVAHIKADRSSNLHISKSYFHHGFDYGGGGRAYGVTIQVNSNECLVEDNVFEHLRHSMLVQAGANGNVFAYNYSHDPFWEGTISNSAGDIVLHGNYVYSNLFEQNICQNIVIDDSHGPNGPHNTMFRNRAEKFGIFFSASNSPDQNFIGNEIPNTGLPYSFVNYTLQGSGHFLHGNNNKGTILPSGTTTLTDTSYAYDQTVNSIPTAQWAGIGTPNVMGSNSIPAYDRYHAGEIFSNACGNSTISIEDVSTEENRISVYPNPASHKVTVESVDFVQTLTVIDISGKIIRQFENVGFQNQLNTTNWQEGVYFLLIELSDDSVVTKVVLKSN